MIIIDIETTGTNPHRHCMLSLGAVDMDSGKTFYGECCRYPDSEVQEEALAINGFTREEIIPGKKQWPHDLYWKFHHWCSQFGDSANVLGGHNVGHLDLPFLEVLHGLWIEVNDSPATPFPFSYRSVDLHTLAFAVFGESLKHSAICERLGLPPEPNPHNALKGAQSEAEAIKRLLNLIAIWHNSHRDVA